MDRAIQFFFNLGEFVHKIRGGRQANVGIIAQLPPADLPCQLRHDRFERRIPDFGPAPNISAAESGVEAGNCSRNSSGGSLNRPTNSMPRR